MIWKFVSVGLKDTVGLIVVFLSQSDFIMIKTAAGEFMVFEALENNEQLNYFTITIRNANVMLLIEFFIDIYVNN